MVCSQESTDHLCAPVVCNSVESSCVGDGRPSKVAACYCNQRTTSCIVRTVRGHCHGDAHNKERRDNKPKEGVHRSRPVDPLISGHLSLSLHSKDEGFDHALDEVELFGYILEEHPLAEVCEFFEVQPSSVILVCSSHERVSHCHIPGVSANEVSKLVDLLSVQ